jgi:hypothetical protein
MDEPVKPATESAVAGTVSLRLRCRVHLLIIRLVAVAHEASQSSRQCPGLPGVSLAAAALSAAALSNWPSLA